jgi:hypothetical protein
MKSTCIVLGLAGALSACGTVSNTSLLDGSNDLGRAQINLYPVRVLAVDGDYPIDVNPVRADPGKRTLRVATVPVAGFRDPPTKDVPFTIEPCKRYYLAAKRSNPLAQDFELIVQQVEDRGDCSVKP